MIKYAIAVFAFIFASLYFIYFFVGRPDIYREERIQAAAPHYYSDTARPIGTIRLIAVYFVPKNKQPAPENEWKLPLEEKLVELGRFHKLSTGGLSTIASSVYPTPILGERESIAYDTNDTNHGNPKALQAVYEEVSRRLLEPGGDLYDEQFAKSPADFKALYILYEGVGASGSDSVALLSRAFLTKDEYRSQSSALFAHEFYHVLGLPDGYELSGTSTTEDLMGYRRSLPLSQSFLLPGTLSKLGL